MVKRNGQTWVAQPTTVPTASRCGACHADTLSGWFDALTIHYDRAPLGRLGEAMALVRGARTFLLYDKHVSLRRASSIATVPEPPFGYVIREHICGCPVTQPERRPEPTTESSCEAPDF